MFDDDTGLQWNLNRWYDPVVGRFVSEDPIDFLADVNWYRYVGNSPGMGVDPEGLQETVWTARGQVAHEAIQEAILRENQSTAKEVPAQRHGTTSGRYDARRGAQKIEIGPASPTGVAAKLRDINSLSGTNKNVFLYESIAEVPKAGSALNYVELTPIQVKKLHEEAREHGLTSEQIFKRATELGRAKSKTVSAKAAHAGGSVFRRGKLACSPKSRRGIAALPRGLTPTSMPRLNGAVSGAVQVGGPVVLDLGISCADDLSGGAVCNLLDNTLGSDPLDMCRNIGRLFGPDWRRHWRYIFHQESAHGGGGRYDAELIEEYKRDQAAQRRVEAIRKYWESQESTTRGS